MKPPRLRFATRMSSGILGGVLVSAFLCFVLIPCVPAGRAAAQSAAAQTEQQQITNILSNPALMTRAYSFFFGYQHHLDTVADQQEAAGKDASALRRVLQERLGFSDQEYEPIQESCDRVAAEVSTLQSEIRSNPGAIANFAETRDREVNAERTTLANELSAQNKMAFETFLVRTFLPWQQIQKAVHQ